MFMDVYVGYLDTTDTFNYDGGDWNGNTPKRITSIFPFSHDVWRLIMSKMKNQEFEGKQTDWGAYVVKVNKEQIIDIFEEVVSKNKSIIEFVGRQKTYKDKDVYNIQNIRNELNQLDSNTLYALTCRET